MFIQIYQVLRNLSEPRDSLSEVISIKVKMPYNNLQCICNSTGINKLVSNEKNQDRD